MKIAGFKKQDRHDSVFGQDKGMQMGAGASELAQGPAPSGLLRVARDAAELAIGLAAFGAISVVCIGVIVYGAWEEWVRK